MRKISSIFVELTGAHYVRFLKKYFSLNEDKVKQSILTQFFSDWQQYMASDGYKRSCHALFEEATVCENEEATFSVCFNLMTTMRKYILKTKSDLMPVMSESYSKRSSEKTFTGSSRGKIRYIGGYAVAKLRYKYSRQIGSTCHSTSSDAVSRYTMGKLSLEVLDCLRISEHKITEITEDSESLQETARRQNLNRGLTNISDGTYNLIEKIVKYCLHYLNASNVSVQGSKLYRHVYSHVILKEDLFQKSVSLCCEEVEHVSTAYTGRQKDPVRDTMTYMLSKVDAVHQVFLELIDKVLSVLVKQFVKDMMSTLKVGGK